MVTCGPSMDRARHVVQCLCGVFVLVACALVTALVFWPMDDLADMRDCGGVALYPVERLAVRGDVGAMAYLGERLAGEGCGVQARAYLKLAAEAGHDGALRVLAARETDAAAPASPCAALLAMMMPGVDEPHQVPGACYRP